MILGKYNQSKTITLDLFEIDGIDLRVDATFATGDVKIIRDEAAEVNTANLPTDEGSSYSLVLTAAEMSAARIQLTVIDQTATKVWLDTTVGVETYGHANAEHSFDLDTANVTLAAATHTGAVIPTVSVLSALPSIPGNWLTAAGIAAGALNGKGDWNIGKTGYSLAATGLDAIVATATGMVEIAKAIWDRVLTGGSHNITNSSGRRLRQLGGMIFADGTAQSGGNNSIQLASGDVTTDDQFRRSKVLIVSGTGAGQEAIITSSVASTDTLTVTPMWLVNPDATSDYEIVPAQIHATVRNGGYDGGFVYIDTVNGAPGVEKGVNGTSTNPSSVVADAYTIAANEKITKFQVEPGSAIVLPSDSSKKQFVGVQYTIDLNGQEVGQSYFEGAFSITGIGVDTQGFNFPLFQTCIIGTATLPPFVSLDTAFTSTVTAGSAGAFTITSGSRVIGASFVFDYGASLNASTLDVTLWRGGTVEIQNAGAGTGSYLFEMDGNGELIVNANCSATTTVTLRGNISRNADVAGVVYAEAANAIAVLGTPAVDISTDIAALNDLSDADILVQVNLALNAAIPELGVAVPTATPSVRTALILMYMALRNELIVQTSGTDALEIHNDAGTKITSKVLTDDGSDFTEAKMT